MKITSFNQLTEVYKSLRAIKVKSELLDINEFNGNNREYHLANFGRLSLASLDVGAKFDKICRLQNVDINIGNFSRALVLNTGDFKESLVKVDCISKVDSVKKEGITYKASALLLKDDKNHIRLTGDLKPVDNDDDLFNFILSYLDVDQIESNFESFSCPYIIQSDFADDNKCCECEEEKRFSIADLNDATKDIIKDITKRCGKDFYEADGDMLIDHGNMTITVTKDKIECSTIELTRTYDINNSKVNDCFDSIDAEETRAYVIADWLLFGCTFDIGLSDLYSHALRNSLDQEETSVLFGLAITSLNRFGAFKPSEHHFGIVNGNTSLEYIHDRIIHTNTLRTKVIDVKYSKLTAKKSYNEANVIDLKSNPMSIKNTINWLLS